MPQPPRQVVVVDDDAVICRLLRAQLMAYRPAWAFRVFLEPRLALRSLRDTPADAVVSDHDMRDDNGAWFLDQVRTACPGTCRILISGSSHDALRDAASEVQAVFRKPVDVVKLLAVIDGWPPITAG